MSSARPARLHVVTNDEIVARPFFLSQATSILEACGDRVAVQLRMKRATARALYELAVRLVDVSRRTGSAVFVNERADIARAAGAAGVQLGRTSVPVASVAACDALDGLMIGYSAHETAEAGEAAAAGAEFIFLGTIWASSTHPGACTAGVELLMRAAEGAAVPVFAIGGVTVARSQEALLAGAYGVAAITGVWDDPRPADAAVSYLESMQAVT